MTTSREPLAAFLAENPLAALVEVVAARGSTPREAGAFMLVAPERTFGTIGGGQLEFMAIDQARQMMARVDASHAPVWLSSPLIPDQDGESGALTAPFAAREEAEGGATQRGGRKAASDRLPPPETLSIPLGPEIGQCCGGRVELSLRIADASVQADLLAQAEAADRALPQVLIFGGGHVGRALAAALALLPLQVTVVETRADALFDMPESASIRLTPMPEALVREAGPRTAFVVLTHDHALDFLIVAEALKRRDAAYVGMIGSKTKKATFRTWYLGVAGGTATDFGRLVSPIGGDAVRDKRPPVIAAVAASEIVVAFASLHDAATMTMSGTRGLRAE